ncbi:MAG: peroxiredoxin-like family protein [Geitlerinemataceae cyanobacterium]
MTLTQQIDDYKAGFRANVPTEAQETMAKATRDLEATDLVAQAIGKGDTAPDFTLPGVDGQPVSSAELRSKGAIVISFYRGGWCPYCSLELRALQAALPEIEAAGATLVAISPQTPDNSLTTAEKNELSFPVLSDVGNAVAREFGLVFELATELRPLYEGFGLDIPAHNGDDTFELPVPATCVIAADGTVLHAFVNVDYTQRLEPAEILAALKS